MSFEDLLGHYASLPIRRFATPGAFLGIGEAEDDVVLLIGSEIPSGAKEGDEIDVFLYLDSEARPIATTRTAKLELGQVAFLEVTELTEFGAFVDWGLAKELLVPFKEQTTEMRVGERYAIGLYVDTTGRLAGTMRISEMLGGPAGAEKVEWKLDEWVTGEAWRNEPGIGLFVIVENAFVGLVPASEPHSLSRGEGARFRITNVLPDGKIELSLRGHAHEELGGDAQKILTVLSRPGAPKIGDKSDPEEIRNVFGLSKKAFKRALGRLLKERKIDIDAQGFVRVLIGAGGQVR
ncbi:MAG: binding domain protein [Labilithrix sp.]|nr:binding domain protein [Labilithrix sp.]